MEFVLNLARDEMGRGVGPGGPRGPGSSLEFRIYRVKFLKIDKISFFLLVNTVQYSTVQYSIITELISSMHFFQ